MRLLVLGGTRFVGRAIVVAAIRTGWSVTTFNRGLSGHDVPGVFAVRGDRDELDDVTDLLTHGPWDAVVDTAAYVPRDTLKIAETMRRSVRQYVMLSTVSVYAGWPMAPLTEHSEVLECPPTAGPDFGPEDVEDGPTRYGHLKAGCERAIRQVFGDGISTILRPGVILGPGEYVGRLPWWLQRIARGGEVLAPGDPGRSIQPVDVRDLAEFVLRLVAERTDGTFNVTAPIGRSTFGDLLHACSSATRTEPALCWVPDERLLKLGVRQWSELPLWRTYDGVWKVDSSGAQAAGLVCRPLQDTVTDTWNWMQQSGGVIDNERSTEIGLHPARERELLSLTN